ncbi:MAG: anthranilate synthase component I family protein [Chitinophagaceae bacterium]|nr:MAG: anthranilate synthase component I family protein [Chitinophagaceae bacterium]
MLNWLKRFNIFCFLESHQYPTVPGRFDLLVGAGSRRRLRAGASLPELEAFVESRRWAFGHLSFALQEAFFELPPGPPDPVGFASYSFFEPEVVLCQEGPILRIEADDPDAVFSALLAAPDAVDDQQLPVAMEARMNREAYLEAIRALLGHIHRGDCYEINFCQEFFAHPASFDPWAVYARLSALSPTPFGGFYRQDDRFLLCASPERFLRKEGQLLTAQPIKGTARRLPNPAADAALRDALRASPKERSENVMVVDLMRNDLSRICTEGSVRVPELFGLYTFPQVHQMISTVTGELRPGTGFATVLEATFPMGSMTGAPKKRVLELIRQYEPSARGLFSGSIGYFHEGDFDFNVVIRSLLYNAADRYLSYQVGSGITAYCEPEAEWEECILKATALERVLKGPGVLENSGGQEV